MGKGRERRTRRSSNLSSIDSNHLPSSSWSLSSTSSLAGLRKTLGVDLGLNLGGFSPSYVEDDSTHRQMEVDSYGEEGDESDYNATFYIKIYMEGIPIGRKLNLLTHDGYYELITSLDCMFSTSILWSEMDEAQCEGCHVLTYEDKEGDWLMVGDVPWEIFLSSVRRLKITKIC